MQGPATREHPRGHQENTDKEGKVSRKGTRAKHALRKQAEWVSFRVRMWGRGTVPGAASGEEPSCQMQEI